MSKHLYRVTLEQTIYVMADTAADAESEAAGYLSDDMGEPHVHAVLVTSAHGIDGDILDSLIHGVTGDVKVAEAIEMGGGK